jgi:D-sedoheptulose 7-phosphate isomerase
MTNTHFIESIGIIEAFAKNTSLIAQIDHIIEKIVSTYKHDGKVLIFGNGGSAADAQHFAGELVSRFYFDRPALSAFALTTDTSVITAIGNDYGYEQVFSRQVSASAKANDVVIAISTSGNSKNVLAALAVAKEKGSFTVGLTGQTGGAMKEVCDVCVCVPSDSTPRIQECHLIIEHAICAGVESELFG